MANRVPLEFTCPKCGEHRIEEVMADVVVASRVWLAQNADGSDPSYDHGEQTNEGGHVDRYQCGNCGWTIINDGGAYERYTQDGLDGDALIARIKAMNAQRDLENPVSHEELVLRIADSFSEMDGESLAEVWNMNLCPNNPVKYVGDSMYEWVQEDASPGSGGSEG